MTSETAPRLVADGFTVTLEDRERRFTLLINDFAVMPGQVVGLTGASGTGKTLLLEALGLLRRPTTVNVYQIDDGRQRVSLGANWINRHSAAVLRGKSLGFVPQSGGLLPFLNVIENVLLTQKIAKRLDKSFALNLLAQLQLEDLARQYPYQLSIGQRQRVSIARALSHRPAIVIADEPTAALDPANAENAMALLINSVLSVGSSLIFSSHDIEMVTKLDIARYHLRLSASAEQNHVQSHLQRWQEASQW